MKKSSTHPLDAAIKKSAAELSRQGVPVAGALILASTGVAGIVERLEKAGRLPLRRTAGIPALWQDSVLHWGDFEGLACWVLEDAPGPADEGGRERPGDPPWARAFPVWLAREALARHLVHVSAATAVVEAGPCSAGRLVVASDHLNLSGGTPLAGLAGCALGPMFPAASNLHDKGLRQALLTKAARLGLPLDEGVVACVPGPALSTPAERRWWRAAGAHAAVQDLAGPLLAAAHAGLTVVAVSAVIDAGDDEIPTLLARAEDAAPKLEELLVALAPDIAREVAAADAEDA
jgi:purine nucleoside phosphorylase